MAEKPASPIRLWESCDTFGALLTALVDERGWSDADLAKAASRFHPQQKEPEPKNIGNWRNGTNPLQKDDLLAIRRALKVDDVPELTALWTRLLLKCRTDARDRRKEQWRIKRPIKPPPAPEQRTEQSVSAVSDRGDAVSPVRPEVADEPDGAAVLASSGSERGAAMSGAAREPRRGKARRHLLLGSLVAFSLAMTAGAIVAFAPFPIRQMYSDFTRGWVRIPNSDISTKIAALMAGWECDASAAAPWDPNKSSGHNGVDLNRIDSDLAVRSCGEALKFWDEGRYHFQLGRAYDRLSQEKGNRAYLDLAYFSYSYARDLKYGAASFALGILYMQRRFPLSEQELHGRVISAYKEAGDAGLSRGKFCYGVALLSGWGSEPPNRSEARYQLESAKRMGYPAAAQLLDRIDLEIRSMPLECNRQDSG
jgi:hypothetical protein